MTTDTITAGKSELQRAVERIPYWYHRIELPGGVVTPGWAPMDAAAYRLPEDLSGQSVLDVGAWDGYWTFEALKRGASRVTAVDDFSDDCGELVAADRSGRWDSFDLCAKALGYTNRIARYKINIESEAYAGRFDVILCFGLLYHTRNPMKVLQNLRRFCQGSIYIESAILDHVTSPYTGYAYSGRECLAEFYPTNEFGSNESNWWVPTLKCLTAWVQAAGFVNIEAWKLTDYPQHISHCRGFVKATV